MPSHTLTFGDVLDMLNPLQHLPIIGTLYRGLVGDEISPVARVAGDFLYGGPIGLMSGVVNASVTESTGSDLGAHAVAWLSGDDGAMAPEPDAAALAAIVPAAGPSADPPPVTENDDALAALAADLQGGATLTATSPADGAAQYQDILEKMNAALDRYEALKVAPPKGPLSY